MFKVEYKVSFNAAVCKHWIRLGQSLSFDPQVLLRIYHNLRSTLENGVRRESNLHNFFGGGEEGCLGNFSLQANCCVIA